MASTRIFANESSEFELPFSPEGLTADKVTYAYRQICSYNDYTSDCVLHPNRDDLTGKSQFVTATWSRRMVDFSVKTRFTDKFLLQTVEDDRKVGFECLNNGQQSWPQRVDKNRQWYVVSPSGARCVVVYKDKDNKDPKKDDKQYFEIWTDSADCCSNVICASDFDAHGDIVGNDGQFGSLQWSPCEQYLLYVAEKKKPKTASFFDLKAKKDLGKGDSDPAPLQGEEFVYRESWGEQLAERHLTVLCILEIKAKTVKVLSQLPDDITPGQGIWGPDGDIVFVGWIHEPFRLGLRFCTERKSYVYRVNMNDEQKCEILSEDGRAVRCPSFSPDKKRLVYLDVTEGGPHNKTSRLVMIDWNTVQKKQTRREVVVDTVNSPYKAGYDPNKEEFPGIYTWADLGTQNNWLSDNVHVIIPSYVRSNSCLLVINTNTKTVRCLYPFDKWPFRPTSLPPLQKPQTILADERKTDLPKATDAQPNEGFAWSCSLLDVRDNNVLLTCSWPDKLPFLVVGSLSLDGKKECGWTILGRDIPLKPCFDWKIYVLDPKQRNAEHKDFDYLDFDAILYLPRKQSRQDRKPPLVLFPHGGPHSVFNSSFLLNPTIFAYCGFAVLMVNFRGSVGFGEDSINSLLGHVGDFDVKDCMIALDRVKKDGLIDPDNVFVYGGSHGGFLAGHLIGQYPDVFRAASMRNPVTNLPSMCGTTDIRDWPFIEAGLPFEYGSIAGEDLLSKLWQASPIRYIDQVKIPVMLNIGLKDLRVPPSQGLEYYKALRARKVPVRCITYPESNHSLAEIDVDADSLVNSILWFTKYLTYNSVS